MTSQPNFKVGDRVVKVGGDAEFEGTVTSVFQKLRAPHGWRYAVEDDRGLVLIQSDKTLQFADILAGADPSVLSENRG